MYISFDCLERCMGIELHGREEEAEQTLCH